MQEAIAAADEELPRYGDPASARAEAAWRRAAVPEAIRLELLALQPPRIAVEVGEAIAHLALDRALRR